MFERNAAPPAVGRKAGSWARGLLTVILLGTQATTAQADDLNVAPADLLDLMFAHEAGPIDHLSRFDGPVTLIVDDPALRSEAETLTARLRDEAGLAIELGDTAADGGAIRVMGLTAAEIAALAPGAACFAAPDADSLADLDDLGPQPAAHRRTALVVVPTDASPQERRDCLHEEVAQALGPLNDLGRLPDSVFNDDNVHGALTAFDMAVLRAAYALPVGLTRAEAARALRAEPGLAPQDANGATLATRAALDLVRLARIAGGPEAEPAWTAAHTALAARPETRLHAAHAAMQLSAFALARGDRARVQALVAEARPVAEEARDEALAATLLWLDAATRSGASAEALRLDAAARAAYGFTPDQAQARQDAVARLAANGGFGA